MFEPEVVSEPYHISAGNCSQLGVIIVDLVVSIFSIFNN